jgi:hypothetical protein
MGKSFKGDDDMASIYLKQHKNLIGKVAKIIEHRIKNTYISADDGGFIGTLLVRSEIVEDRSYVFKVRLFLPTKVIISEYDKYLVFGLDLRESKVKAMFMCEDYSVYLRRVNDEKAGDRDLLLKEFPELADIGISRRNVPKWQIDKFKETDYYNTRIIQKIKEWERNTDLDIQIKTDEFPFVSDKYILPYLVFDTQQKDSSKPEGYGFHYGPKTWRSKHMKLSLDEPYTDLTTDIKSTYIPTALLTGRLNDIKFEF